MKLFAVCFWLPGVEDPLDDEEAFQRAEHHLIAELQHKYFAAELAQFKKGVHPKSNLDLSLTDQGLIRCEGRLQNASLPWDTIHPILLPKNGPVIRAYVQQIHFRNHHIGVGHTMFKIRE